MTDLCDICGETYEIEREEFPFYVCDRCAEQQDREWEEEYLCR